MYTNDEAKLNPTSQLSYIESSQINESFVNTMKTAGQNSALSPMMMKPDNNSTGNDIYTFDQERAKSS